MATGTAAELLTLSGKRNPYPGKLGVVEEGALADLLLVDGDPIADIGLIADPEKNLLVIMKDGRVYKDALRHQGESMNKYGAEFFGTFWLVFGGCGSAVLAAAFPDVGIGLLGVSLAFGLTVLTMAYAIGHISGCHLNPAVSIGPVGERPLPASELVPYIIAQVLGGIAAGGVLYLIASGKAGFDVSAGFASNGFGEHSPGGYGRCSAALVTEVVMTMMFLLVILGATDKRAPQGFAPIAIGLVPDADPPDRIPVTNTSVNPARSTGVAVFVGDWAIAQLWLFWVAPIAGALLGAAVYRFIGGTNK